MDVTCPACAARYAADDEELRGKTARMRCKACDAAWLAPPAATLASDPPGTKRAAVIRRGSERERRDLFAERDPDIGSVKDSHLPPPAFALRSGVGARNENSVLFRVDQLLGGRQAKAPEPPITHAREQARSVDDEGVIDLRALTSSAPPQPTKPPVAPLFAEPPPVTVDVGNFDAGRRPTSAGGWGASPNVAPRAPSEPRSRMPLFGAIAAAAAFVLVAGYGLVLAFGTEEPVKHTAAMIAEPSADPPVNTDPPHTEPDPAEVASAPSGDGDAPSHTTEAKPTKGKKTKARAKHHAKAAPAPAPKPRKAADPCHCKGNFDCILACTAKGGK